MASKKRPAPAGDEIDALMAEHGIAAPGGGDDIDALMAEHGIAPPFDVAHALHGPDRFQPPAQVDTAPMTRAPTPEIDTSAQLEADKPSFLGRLGMGLRGAATAVARTPGELVQNPSAAIRGLVTGAARGATRVFGAKEPAHPAQPWRDMGERLYTGDATPEDMAKLRANWEQRKGVYDRRALAADPSAIEDPGPFDPRAVAARMTAKLNAYQDELDQAPNSQVTGELLGPSAGKLAGGAVMKGAKATTFFGKLARAGAASATAAGMDSRGDPEAMAGGALVGTGGYAAASGLTAAGRGILQAAPWVKRFARARDAGLIEGAEALPKGRPGIAEASRQSRDAILDRDAQMTQEEGDKYSAVERSNRARAANLQPAGERLADIQQKARFPNGELIRGAEGVHQAAGDAFANLSNAHDVGDLLAARRAQAEAAAFESPNPTTQQLAERKIYGAIRGSVRESAPEVGAADDAFTRFKGAQARRNDILFRSEEGGRPAHVQPDEALENAPASPARAQMRVGDEIKAARALGRIHDKTEPGNDLTPYLEELAGQDPAFAKAIDKLVAKKALEETRFGIHGEGSQATLHTATGVGSALKFAGKNIGAIARRLDDSVLRRAKGTTVPAFFARAARIGRGRQDEEQP